jgi:hypothetical protein
VEDLARTAKGQPGQARREQQRHGQRPHQGRPHGTGHGREQLVLDALEGEQRQIGGGDHAHAEEDGARHLQRGRDGIARRQGLVLLGLAAAQNVLDHDHGAVDQNAEVDGSQRQQIGRDLGVMHEDKGQQQRHGNRQRHDQRRARAAQEQQQHQGHDDHAFGQGLAHGMRGALDQRGAVQIGHDLDVGRQQLLVELLHGGMDALQRLGGLASLSSSTMPSSVSELSSLPRMPRRSTLP